jgi:uncharacterized membrane protein YjgN (DUF898 family)
MMPADAMLTTGVPTLDAAEDRLRTLPDRSGARFHGDPGAFWRLLSRGGGLLIVTLGIYRFWLVTDIRRFLWGNTELAGDFLEYLGTARELLLGFLMALSLLVPVYLGFFLVDSHLGVLSEAGGIAGLAALVLLGQFAVYRARRYRLTRTVFRGLRLHQTGSASRYAVCAVCWWGLIACTLGLAYPWACASLERYKMRNTHYGDLQGRFDGSGTRLFVRGLPLWSAIAMPTFVGLTVAFDGVDWRAFAEAVSRGGENTWGRIEGANPGFGSAVIYAILALLWAAAAFATLYPAFQAMLLRWWLCGLRFGDVRSQSGLRTTSVYAVYLRFTLCACLLLVAIAIVALVMSFLIGRITRWSGRPELSEDVGAVVSVGLYAASVLAYSSIYQALVRLRLWRLGLESLQITGLDALERVRSTVQPSSALGEGLVDALHMGGF